MGGGAPAGGGEGRNLTALSVTASPCQLPQRGSHVWCGNYRNSSFLIFKKACTIKKILKQIFLILLISFLGEALHALLPLPIPASIYGLVLMLAALCAHIIRLEDVKGVGRYLVEVMTVFFIPITVSTLIVMAVSGVLTQAVVSRKGGEKDE